jgi:hypothetical protein
MSSLAISSIVFACIFGGALIGMLLRICLPEGQLNAESKDVIKLAAGIIATMTALVLGLLVASAKTSFDAQRDGLAQLSASVIYLDRVLAHYGPESQDARETLRSSIADLIERTWPRVQSSGKQTDGLSATAGRYEGLFDQVQTLTPKTDAQRALQAEALSLVKEIGRTRWSIFAHKGSSIPVPFFVVMVSWLMLTLACFSLFARPSATVVAALLVCSLVVSSAIFLISELDRPFHGIIQISSAPLQNALEQLGK